MAETHTNHATHEERFFEPFFFARVVGQLAMDYYPDRVARQFMYQAYQQALESLRADLYLGNPEDYADDAEFEAVLLTSAENDTTNYGVPASKSTVDKLENVVVEKEVECPICMDLVEAGKAVTNLPCGHGYHGDCIKTWLSSRNSCPVCKLELPTDDADYEKQRKMRELTSNMTNLNC